MQTSANNIKQITRYLNDPSNKSLKDNIEKWRTESEVNEILYQQTLKIWELSAYSRDLEKINYTNTSHRLSKRLSVTSSGRSNLFSNIWFRGIAAAILIFIVFGIYKYNSNKVEYIVKTTNSYAIDSVFLSDGSKVFLDKNTTIKYPKHFKGNIREMFLVKGNAFFEIQRDTLHPFSVILDKSSIKVLGTSFNINKINNELRICVKTGKVLFLPPSNLEPSMLSAGEGISYDGALRIERINAVNENSDTWLSKSLVFVDAPLEDVVKKLAAYYNIEIELQGDIKRLGMFNAKFNNATLKEIMEVIEQTYPVRLTKQSEKYFITIRK